MLQMFLNIGLDKNEHFSTLLRTGINWKVNFLLLTTTSRLNLVLSALANYFLDDLFFPIFSLDSVFRLST